MPIHTLGALEAPLGQDGQTVSPLIMALRSMSLLVRLVLELLPDILVVTVHPGMHG